MFVNITACSENQLSRAIEIYIILLMATMVFFAFQNMRMNNHFRLEGQAGCLTVIILAFLYFTYIVILHVVPVEAYYYKVVFRLIIVFSIVISPTAAIIIFMPQVR